MVGWGEKASQRFKAAEKKVRLLVLLDKRSFSSKYQSGRGLSISVTDANSLVIVVVTDVLVATQTCITYQGLFLHLSSARDSKPKSQNSRPKKNIPPRTASPRARTTHSLTLTRLPSRSIWSRAHTHTHTSRLATALALGTTLNQKQKRGLKSMKRPGGWKRNRRGSPNKRARTRWNGSCGVVFVTSSRVPYSIQLLASVNACSGH